jgi:hypothetical protein
MGSVAIRRDVPAGPDDQAIDQKRMALWGITRRWFYYACSEARKCKPIDAPNLKQNQSPASWSKYLSGQPQDVKPKNDPR